MSERKGVVEQTTLNDCFSTGLLLRKILEQTSEIRQAISEEVLRLEQNKINKPIETYKKAIYKIREAIDILNS
jgi:hypothetical protein